MNDMTLCRFFQTTGLLRTLAVSLTTVVLAVHASTAMAVQPLRVCADPDNLPFSKSEGPERGIYVDLAELVAQRLNAAPVQYTWWLTFYQRRALRNTAKECDAVFALPTDADYKARGLQKTAAFLDVGYALVSSPGFTFNGLDDLKGKRLAVQFQTNPHILLSQRNDLPFSTFKTSDEIFAALAKGEIDAGFLWGPVAGFDNLKQHGGRWKVTPLTGPDLTGQVSVAVQRDKAELVKDIDAALLALKPQIAELAAKYGFPKTAPVKLDLVAAAAFPAKVQTLAARDQAVTVPAHWMVKTSNETDSKAASKVKPKNKATVPSGSSAAKAATAGAAVQVAAAQTPALSADAQLGRVRFNDQCSHCHGSDAASPIRERDVRRLKMRYDAKWLETATTTIKNGRSDAGMPPWKDILKEPEIQQLLSYLETVQK
jgi:polar amino acid transport system substrate-binding protein